jgi:hypothetical protein
MARRKCKTIVRHIKDKNVKCLHRKSFYYIDASDESYCVFNQKEVNCMHINEDKNNVNQGHFCKRII